MLVKPAVVTPAPGHHPPIQPSLPAAAGSWKRANPGQWFGHTLHPSPTREGGAAAAQSSAFPCILPCMQHPPCGADSKQQGGSPAAEKAESPASACGKVRCGPRLAPRRSHGTTWQATPLLAKQQSGQSGQSGQRGAELCDPTSTRTSPDLQPGSTRQTRRCSASGPLPAPWDTRAGRPSQHVHPVGAGVGRGGRGPELTDRPSTLDPLRVYILPFNVTSAFVRARVRANSEVRPKTKEIGMEQPCLPAAACLPAHLPCSSTFFFEPRARDHANLEVALLPFDRLIGVGCLYSVLCRRAAGLTSPPQARATPTTRTTAALIGRPHAIRCSLSPARRSDRTSTWTSRSCGPRTSAVGP